MLLGEKVWTSQLHYTLAAEGHSCLMSELQAVAVSATCDVQKELHLLSFNQTIIIESKANDGHIGDRTVVL